MIVCPSCGAASHVTNSIRTGATMRRYRHCKSCHHTWSTVELTSAQAARLEKLERLNRDRMILGRATTRGFTVPEKMRPEYFALRRKHLTAAEAGSVLGLVATPKNPSPRLQKFLSRQEQKNRMEASHA